MSVLTYNGVVLPYAINTGFQMTPVYDESQTDWHLNRYEVVVQTLINFNYLSVLAPDLVNNDGTPKTTNPAAILDVLKSRLLRPRRKLSFTFNGVDIIAQKQDINKGTVDSKNGPQPQRCVFTEMTNNLFLLTYSIVAHYWETPVNTAPTPGVQAPNAIANDVLYNRWSETHDYDYRQYMTRTRSGKFVIRSDKFDDDIMDKLRDSMAVVGVPEGYVRDSSSYKQDPSGLAIEYKVVDREVFKLPPDPAYRAEGRYVETMSQNMAVRAAECWVRMEGSRKSDQTELIHRAVAVCSSKLNARDNELQKHTVLGYFQIITLAQVAYGLYDNWAECTIRMFGAVGETGGNRLSGMAGFGDMDTTTPLVDISDSPEYSPWGTTEGLLMKAAAYWDPSLRNLKIDPKTNQLTDGLVPGQAGDHLET